MVGFIVMLGFWGVCGFCDVKKSRTFGRRSVIYLFCGGRGWLTYAYPEKNIYTRWFNTSPNFIPYLEVTTIDSGSQKLVIPERSPAELPGWNCSHFSSPMKSRNCLYNLLLNYPQKKKMLKDSFLPPSILPQKILKQKRKTNAAGGMRTMRTWIGQQNHGSGLSMKSVPTDPVASRRNEPERSVVESSEMFNQLAAEGCTY